MKRLRLSAISRSAVYILVCAFLFSGIPQVVAADTAQNGDDLNSITNETPWYDPNATPCSEGTGSSGPLTAGSANFTAGDMTHNGAAIITYLHSNGFDWIAAAGAAASMWGESTWNPEAQGTGGRGLIGWTPPETLPDSAFTGNATADLNAQLPLIIAFVNNAGDQQYVAAMNQQNSVADAANIWGPFVERFGVNDVHPEGIALATQIMNSLMSGKSTSSIGTATADTGNGSGCSTGTNASCAGVATTTGDAKILAAAECYKGIYYEWGGGHQGYAAYKAACPDPSNPPNNQPHGGPVNGDPAGLSGNPSPCALDCSGLVSVAVDDAFKQTYMWTVGGSTGMSGGSWKPESISNAQAGDIVTIPNDHVEIVVSVNVAKQQVTTFGAHATGEANSQVTQPFSSWPGGAFRWTGPGSN